MISIYILLSNDVFECKHKKSQTSVLWTGSICDDKYSYAVTKTVDYELVFSIWFLIIPWHVSKVILCYYISDRQYIWPLWAHTVVVSSHWNQVMGGIFSIHFYFRSIKFLLWIKWDVLMPSGFIWVNFFRELPFSTCKDFIFKGKFIQPLLVTPDISICEVRL